MLSFQSVQVEQIVPQAQIQPLQTQAEPKKPEKSDFSFLDLLRAEQQPVEQPKEQQPVSKAPDERESSPSDEQFVKPADKKDEPVREKLPQDEKTRVSQKETESKEEKTMGLRADTAIDPTVVALFAPEMVQTPVAQPSVYTILQNYLETADDVARDDAVIAPLVSNTIGVELNNAAWQLVRAHDADLPVIDDEALDEAVQTLLDENAFLLPEIIADDEELTQAQQVALEYPVQFLQGREMPLAEQPKAETVLDGADKKTEIKAAKSKPRLAITDLRTQKTETAVETENAVAKTQNKNGADFAFEQNREPSVQLTMEMTGAAHIDQNITAANTQTAAANGSTFQSMLAASIQENAPEFVKAGNIVLRDGNQGAINLILRPESLGNVKISLSLSDKVITGQITVQSQEAYNAFKDSIDSLKAAFAQSGFEAQGFDLNFAGNQNFAESQQDWQNPAFAIRAEKVYGDLVAGEVTAEAMAYELSDYGINIVA